MTIVYFDYVQRSCSSLYRLLRFTNCSTYITLHYIASARGLILRKILDCTGGDIYGERGARAYNGGLGQSPDGVRGQSSPEADSILAFER